MQEATKGKMTNTRTGEELKFPINPASYQLGQGYLYQIEPCLAQPAPLVSFRSGDAATLSFQLIFDRDTDKEADPKSLLRFLRTLNKIDEASRSAPEISFSYGEFSFTGFVTKYSVNCRRFDQRGNATCAIADISLVSSGAYEHA